MSCLSSLKRLFEYTIINYKEKRKCSFFHLETINVFPSKLKINQFSIKRCNF